MQRIIVLLAIMELDILKNNWSDAQIVDVSYQKGTLLLALKDYQNIIYEYLFENVITLSFENYLNEDISEIRSSFWKEENDTICQIDILSAWANKEIVSFSFFTHYYGSRRICNI